MYAYRPAEIQDKKVAALKEKVKVDHSPQQSGEFGTGHSRLDPVLRGFANYFRIEFSIPNDSADRFA